MICCDTEDVSELGGEEAPSPSGGGLTGTISLLGSGKVDSSNASSVATLPDIMGRIDVESGTT